MIFKDGNKKKKRLPSIWPCCYLSLVQGDACLWFMIPIIIWVSPALHDSTPALLFLTSFTALTKCSGEVIAHLVLYIYLYMHSITKCELTWQWYLSSCFCKIDQFYPHLCRFLRMPRFCFTDHLLHLERGRPLSAIWKVTCSINPPALSVPFVIFRTIIFSLPPVLPSI